MKWVKRKIDTNDLQNFYNDYSKLIKSGNTQLDNCYCLWKYKDSPLVYLHNLFDFIDNYKNLSEFMPIEEFYFCQPK